MRKIALAALATVLAISMAGCGGSKPVEKVEVPEKIGEMVIPDNWDGVTFKSNDGKITIVAPEKGWTCTQLTDGSLVINNGDDIISYSAVEYESADKINTDEDKIQKALGKFNDLSDFTFDKDDDGTIHYSYIAEKNDEAKVDAITYSEVTIKGTTKTTATVQTSSDTEEKLDELKALLKSNVTVEE